MKDSIDMIIDFKDSCETIVRYTFFIEDNPSESQYTEVLITSLNRLNEVSNENIDFDSNITFERKLSYTDSFIRALGKYFKKVINN